MVLKQFSASFHELSDVRIDRYKLANITFLGLKYGIIGQRADVVVRVI